MGERGVGVAGGERRERRTKMFSSREEYLAHMYI